MPYLIPSDKLDPGIFDLLENDRKSKRQLFVCQPLKAANAVVITPFETWLQAQQGRRKSPKNINPQQLL